MLILESKHASKSAIYPSDSFAGFCMDDCGRIYVAARNRTLEAMPLCCNFLILVMAQATVHQVPFSIACNRIIATSESPRRRRLTPFQTEQIKPPCRRVLRTDSNTNT